MDLQDSLARAAARFGRSPRRRSDAGRLRFKPTVQRALEVLTAGQERPRMVDLKRDLDTRCQRLGVAGPSRAALYQALPKLRGRVFQIRPLPAAVRGVLYNLDADGTVPGPQLAFYCFNYGTIPVVSFAAGLPWLDLFLAARLTGWRPRSFGLLRSVLRVRGIA